MALDIKNAKIELIQWLTTIDDKALIQKLLEMRNETSNDWWKNISDEEKESIEKGLEDLEKGNVKPDSEAQKIYGKWL